MCFPPVPIAVIQKSLTMCAAAEGPFQWGGKRLRVVLDFVNQAIAFGSDCVLSGAGRKMDWIFNVRYLCRRCGVRHSMLLLTLDQSGMTLGAGRCSHVVALRRISFTWPPAWFGDVFLGGHLFHSGRGHFGRQWYLEQEYKA